LALVADFDFPKSNLEGGIPGDEHVSVDDAFHSGLLPEINLESKMRSEILRSMCRKQ
jgi:hypothetical protein